MVNLKITLFMISWTVGLVGASFKDLYQLEGKWKMNTSKGVLIESWEKVSPTELHGRSYRASAKDTVQLEEISLLEDDAGIHYVPIVKNHNDGQPVRFTLISSESRRFVFENKNHDFPKRIIYHFITADSIVARVEDDSKGSNYYFARIKTGH
jgi:Domain of unknown function (DUF6265)